MSGAQRPIEVDILDIPESNMVDLSFNYTYPIYESRKFNIQYKNEIDTIGTEGVEIQLKNIDKTKNEISSIVVNGDTYYVSRLIVSNGMDQIGTTNDYDYSLVIVHEPVSGTTSNLYVILPIVDNSSPSSSDMQTFLSDIGSSGLNLNNTKVLKNMDLNLNTLINGSIFYYYYINNNLFIIFDSTPLSLDIENSNLEQFFAQTITDTIVPSASVYISGASPQNFLPSANPMDDIYIDCSPEGDTNTQIIKPRNVFAIKPIVNPESLGNNSTLFLVMFLSIIICIVVYKSTGKLMSFSNSFSSFIQKPNLDFSLEQMRNNFGNTNGGLMGLIREPGYIIFLILAIINIVFASIFLSKDQLTNTTGITNTVLSNSTTTSTSFSIFFLCIYIFHFILLKSNGNLETSFLKEMFMILILVFLLLLAASYFLTLLMDRSNISDGNWAIYSLLLTPVLSCLWHFTKLINEAKNGTGT